MKQHTLLLTFFLGLLAQACGQTGPLYLPDQAPPIYVPDEAYQDDEDENEEETDPNGFF